MQRDVGDILDRWSIAKLKAERIGAAENKKEFEAFDETYKRIRSLHPEVPWDLFATEMVRINSTIWFLEAAMKSGKEFLPNPVFLDDEKNMPMLAAIGRNAILIRNVNGFRVGLKNILNSFLGEGYMDIKQNHMSE